MGRTSCSYHKKFGFLVFITKEYAVRKANQNLPIFLFSTYFLSYCFFYATLPNKSCNNPNFFFNMMNIPGCFKMESSNNRFSKFFQIVFNIRYKGASQKDTVCYYHVTYTFQVVYWMATWCTFKPKLEK